MLETDSSPIPRSLELVGLQSLATGWFAILKILWEIGASETSLRQSADAAPQPSCAQRGVCSYAAALDMVLWRIDSMVLDLELILR